METTKTQITKCLAIGCNSESVNFAQKQFSDYSVIGFCHEHTPLWLENLKVSHYSPAGGWYKRVETQ